MKPKPWDDPEAEGIGRQIEEVEWNRQVRQKIDRLREQTGTLIQANTALFPTLVDFISDHNLSVRRDKWPNAEGWALHFDLNRLSRTILVYVHRANEEWEIKIRTYAAWIDPDADSYVLTREHRAFQIMSSCPPTKFRDTLEIAYHDAATYELSDLRGQ